MNPLTALFSLKGRLRRRDFWLGSGVIWLAAIAMVVTAGVALPHIWPGLTPGRGRAVAALICLPVFLWMAFALLTKRFHDRGRSAWAIANALYPVRGWIWGVYECCADGTVGANAYGVSPKGDLADHEVF